MKKTILLAAGILSAALVSAKNPKIVVLEEELLFGSEYASQFHASTIAEASNGDLVVACFGGRKEGADDVATWMVRRKKGESAWGKAFKIMDAVRLDGKNYLGAYNPVLFQLPEYAGREMLLFTKYGRNGSFSSCTGYIQRSSDCGESWSEPEKLGAMRTETVGADKNQPLMVGNRIIAPSEGPNPLMKGQWMEHYEISDDFGRTWRRVDLREHSDIVKHTKQPALLRMKDGSIRSYQRTADGCIATSRSTDGGETWSIQEPLPLKNNNSGIAATQLKDGRYLLAYDDNDTFTPGKTNGPRWPLVLAISKDGLNWKTIGTLAGPTKEGHHEFSYPSMITAKNGDVLIVFTYCGIDNDYRRRGNIKFMRLRIK